MKLPTSTVSITADDRLADVREKTAARDRALDAAKAATEAWEASIRRAAEIHTHREVGDAAGISRPRVGQITSEATTKQGGPDPG